MQGSHDSERALAYFLYPIFFLQCFLALSEWQGGGREGPGSMEYSGIQELCSCLLHLPREVVGQCVKSICKQ